MGKAKLTPTGIDLIKKIKDTEKKQAGRNIADYAGVTTVSKALGSGGQAATSSTLSQPYQKTGGRISGEVSIFPKTVTVSTGVISLIDSSAGNVTKNTSNINVIGEDDAEDTLVTINGNSDTGQVVFLKAAGYEITLQHGTATDGLYCPGATDYVIGVNEGVVLIYGGTGNYWTVLGPEGGAAGATTELDNLGTTAINANLNMNSGKWLQINNNTIGIKLENATANGNVEFKSDTSGNLDVTRSDNTSFSTSFRSQHASEADQTFGITIGSGSVTTADTVLAASTAKLKIEVGGAQRIEIDATTGTDVEQKAIGVSPTYALFNDDSSPNDFDTLGSLLFEGNDSSSNQTIYGKIDCYSNDVTNGTEDGEINISVRGAGFSGAAELILNHTTLELHRQLSNSLGNGCEFVLYNDDLSMNDNQIVGQITFDSNDSAGNQTTYGHIKFTADDVTNGTEDGGFDLELMHSGSLRNWLYVDSGGINISVPSGDTTDFYVAGTKEVVIDDLGLGIEDGKFVQPSSTGNDTIAILPYRNATLMTTIGTQGTMTIPQKSASVATQTHANLDSWFGNNSSGTFGNVGCTYDSGSSTGSGRYRFWAMTSGLWKAVELDVSST